MIELLTEGIVDFQNKNYIIWVNDSQFSQRSQTGKNV